jgi:hydroxypyruvate isomerase
MPNRRTFLAAAGAGAASLALSGPSRGAEDPSSAGRKTWLTYAVNVEMFWNELPFLDRLRKVAEAGFTHYEFWPWKGKDIDAVRKLNDELGLVPTQFTGFSGFTSPAQRAPFLEAIRAAIPVADTLGVKKLTVVAGQEAAGLGRDEQTQAVIDTLKAGAEVVAPAGIMLMLEPLNVLVDHPRQLVSRSDHAAAIIRAVGSPHVKILFDCYHQQITEGNLTNNIRAYKDLIGYFQIADHPGRHEPGTGEVNYAHVLRVIHDIGYDGAIGLELRPQGDAMEALKAVRGADAAAQRH